MNLNLSANGKAQELILAYLQENASETLAEKINNGTMLFKDGKRLTNKKKLDGFMAFASEEAKKLAGSGARSACVEDSVVYGWAIHYFEEDSIEGTLYNEDDTEYRPLSAIRKAAAKPAPAIATPKKPEAQFSLFDLIDGKKEEASDKITEQAENKTAMTEQADDSEVVDSADGEAAKQTDECISEETEQAGNPSIDEIADALQRAVDEKNGSAPKKELPLFFVQYMTLKKQYPEHIVLSRLGDFYEAFDNDAVILSDELDLMLTGRDVGLGGRVPTVGFPYHASDKYIAKIREKHNVVILESDGKVVKVMQSNSLTGEVFDGTEAQSSSPLIKDALAYLCDMLGGKVDYAR